MLASRTPRGTRTELGPTGGGNSDNPNHSERKMYKNSTPPSGATVPSNSINRLVVYHSLSCAKCMWNCVISMVTIIITCPCGHWNVRMLYTWQVPVSLCKAHPLLAASLLFLGFHCLVYKHLQSPDYSSIPLHETHASVKSLRLCGILFAILFIKKKITNHLVLNLAVSKQMPGTKMTVIITVICTIPKSINLLVAVLGNEHFCSKVTPPFYIK